MYVDKKGRVYSRWFDRYGESLAEPHTPEANRRALIMERTKPSNKPVGGYRGKPPKHERPVL